MQAQAFIFIFIFVLPGTSHGCHMLIGLYAHHIRTMRTLYPENVDQVQRPSHVAKKTMETVFFNGTGLHVTDILPQNQKMDAEYFAEHRVYYTIGFDLLSNRKEFPTEKMRCPF
jgi:hypothetical protein